MQRKPWKKSTRLRGNGSLRKEGLKLQRERKRLSSLEMNDNGNNLIIPNVLLPQM